MRYYTREWYRLHKMKDFYLLLKANPKAAAYDEAFFQKVYQKKLKEYLALKKALSKYLKKNVARVRADKKLPEAEKQSVLRFWETEGHTLYDAEKCTREFDFILQEQVKMLQEVLPESLRQKIPDLRVLSFSVADRKTIDRMQAWCQNIEIQTEAMTQGYYSHLRQEGPDPRLAPVLRTMHFQQCYIFQAFWQGQDYVIDLDNTDGAVTVDKLVFVNAAILQQDTELKDSIWLQEEIYFEQDQYEIHLLVNKEGTVSEFTLRADAVDFIHMK